MKKIGKLRIIGGRWKRRWIRFPSLPELRPSPDSVRETLFNWLNKDIPESACLDLYAGTGAFGFEAVSRGASHAILVESERIAVSYLATTLENLGAADEVEIYHGQALRYLKTTTRQFDLVFIDPPFRKMLLAETFEALVVSNCLNPFAKIYVESAKSNSPLPIPTSWHIIRESVCGMVQSTLIQT